MSFIPSYNHTESLLEDVFEPIINPYCPVVVFDFKVYAHAINQYSDLVEEVARSEEDMKSIFKAFWAYKLNRGPDPLPQFPFVGLVVDDLKGELSAEFAEASSTGYGYWRHLEAHKLDLAEYKGGRGVKPPMFDIVQEAGYEYINSPGSTFSFFSKNFFEADDIAGLVARLKRNANPSEPLAQRHVILSTVDGDWQGLVSDAHGIVWANTGPWLPRLRSETEVKDYYLRKDGLVITSAKGCYDVKEETGDAGDNLAPGTPLRFFDLYNEDAEWSFTPQDTQAILEVLNTTTPSNREDHFDSAQRFLLSKGIGKPEIGETDDYDKRAFFAKAKRIRDKNLASELRGRNKTICLSIVDKVSDFEKCKKLAIEDERTKEKIKLEQEKSKKCKEADDKKCVKEINAILRPLKKLRDALKAQLSEFVSTS